MHSLTQTPCSLKMLRSFVLHIPLDKGIYDGVNSCIGDQGKIDDLLHEAFKPTQLSQETNASVVSSQIRYVESRDDEHNHNCGIF